MAKKIKEAYAAEYEQPDPYKPGSKVLYRGMDLFCGWGKLRLEKDSPFELYNDLNDYNKIDKLFEPKKLHGELAAKFVKLVDSKREMEAQVRKIQTSLDQVDKLMREME